MTPAKATLFTAFMLTALALWGVGIYTGDAAAGSLAIDGYGVVATR